MDRVTGNGRNLAPRWAMRSRLHESHHCILSSQVVYCRCVTRRLSVNLRESRSSGLGIAHSRRLQIPILWSLNGSLVLIAYRKSSTKRNLRPILSYILGLHIGTLCQKQKRMSRSAVMIHGNACRYRKVASGWGTAFLRGEMKLY
jgi:hypothetical protein